jgi:hypothetical protein
MIKPAHPDQALLVDLDVVRLGSFVRTWRSNGPAVMVAANLDLQVATIRFVRDHALVQSNDLFEDLEVWRDEDQPRRRK